MANTLEFAKELADATEDPALDRWAFDLQEFIATQRVYLGRRLEQMPGALRDKYWELLAATLATVSEDFRVTVSAELRATLTRTAPAEARIAIEQKVYAIPGEAA